MLLSHQEPSRDGGLFRDAHGREKVGVAPLVIRLLKVIQLDPAHINQGLNQIVGLTQAHAQRLSQLALSKVGLLLKDLERAIFELLVYHYKEYVSD